MQKGDRVLYVYPQGDCDWVQVLDIRESEFWQDANHKALDVVQVLFPDGHTLWTLAENLATDDDDDALMNEWQNEGGEG